MRVVQRPRDGKSYPGGNSCDTGGIPDGAGRAAELADLAARATQYAVRARGDGTRRAYRSAWAGYVAWCRDLGREPLARDPETIAMYAVRRADAGRALSSIRVDLAAIATAHRLAGIPLDLRDARLAPVLEGIARTNGAGQGSAARTRPGDAAARLRRRAQNWWGSASATSPRCPDAGCASW